MVKLRVTKEVLSLNATSSDDWRGVQIMSSPLMSCKYIENCYNESGFIHPIPPYCGYKETAS